MTGTLPGTLGEGFTTLSSDFKAESKFTKQKSGSEFSVEGMMFAKAITLKEHGLLGGEKCAVDGSRSMLGNALGWGSKGQTMNGLGSLLGLWIYL